MEEKAYDKSINCSYLLFSQHVIALEKYFSTTNCGITHFSYASSRQDVANTIEHESRSKIKIMLLIIISEFNECER